MIPAWNYEAANIFMDDLNSDFMEKAFFRNNKVTEFLNIERDKKFFIVAPKGFGKTLLLKVKSQLYRNKSKGATFIPKNQLCERLFDVFPSLGNEFTSLFSQKEVWEKIWKLSLILLILRHLEEEEPVLPPEINKVIYDAKSLNAILGSLLTSRKNVFKLIELIPGLLIKVERINRPVYVFIDNIDEAFVRFIREYRMYDDKSKEIWLNTQIGLMTAIRDICDNNSHIKIYAAIQTEAIQRPKDPLFLQIKDYCTELNYQFKEVKMIFENNIKRMDFHDLKNPITGSDIERFLGFEHFKHRFVRGADGKARTEEAFEYIYRHTLGRPREIVMMGAEINHIAIADRNMDTVADMINESSSTILLQYQSEIMGPTEYNAYETFCQHATSNVLSKDELNEIKRTVAETCKYENIDNYLFKLGLLGWTEERFETDVSTQKFLPAGRFVYDESKILPHAAYYVLHSCMDKDLFKYHGKLFYNQSNIIGDNNAFYAKKIVGKNSTEKEYILFLQSGNLAMERRDYEEAISDFEKAYDILITSYEKEHSLIANTNYQIGIAIQNIISETKDHILIQLHKERAIEHFLNSGNIYTNLGQLAKNIEDRKLHAGKAVPPFSHILELDEKNLKAIEGLIQCAEIEGNSQQVLNLIHKAEKVKTELQYQNNLKSNNVLANVTVTSLSIFDRIKWDLQRNVNVVLGKNGYGKTHLLRLIICLLQQNKETLYNDFLKKGDSCTAAVISLWQENSLVTSTLKSVFADNFQESDVIQGSRRLRSFDIDDFYFKESSGKFPILAIPDNRYIDKSTVAFSRQSDAKTEGLNNIEFLVHSGSYAFVNQVSISAYIEQFLHKIAVTCYLARSQDKIKKVGTILRNNPLVKMVENAFTALTDKGFRFVDIEPMDQNYSTFKILVSTEGNPDPIPIQKASQGTLSVIGILGLIYNYLESLNSTGELGNNDVTKACGIVIIEEVDAHLHPSWQQRIINILRTSFPNVQYILSCHSPLVVAGCYEKEVCVLKKNDDLQSFYLHQIAHDFLGWTTSELYNEDIFNIDEYDDNYLYYAELSDKADHIKQQIEHYCAHPALQKEPEMMEKQRQLNYIDKFLKKQEEKSYVSNMISENVYMKNQLKKQAND